MDNIKYNKIDKHLLNNFYVIAIITNPVRYKRRPELFKQFALRMENYGVKLYVVEAAYGDREFSVTDSNNPRHIQLRTKYELWHKENMINIGISRLPSNWEYVAWIDGDIDFIEKDWPLETVQQLQHYPIVQLFTDAIDLGPDNEVLTIFKSFAYCYRHKLPRKPIINTIPQNNITQEPFITHDQGQEPVITNDQSITQDSSVIKNEKLNEEIKNRNCSFTCLENCVNNPKKQFNENIFKKSFSNAVQATNWHPGYGWAATKDAINTMGGLLDFGILGSGDNHMACGFIGEIHRSFHVELNIEYKKLALEWQERVKHLEYNIGYVKGSIFHYWHGKKKDRKYKERWSILVDNNFNPLKDIYKDSQGLWVLNSGKYVLRDEIQDYFRARNEDSIDK